MGWHTCIKTKRMLSSGDLEVTRTACVASALTCDLCVLSVIKIRFSCRLSLSIVRVHLYVELEINHSVMKDFRAFQSIWDPSLTKASVQTQAVASEHPDLDALELQLLFCITSLQ